MAVPTVGSATQYYGQPVNVGTFCNITAAQTFLVKSGEGALYSITFNNPVATGTVKIYDGLSASGVLIGSITVPSSELLVTLDYNVYFTTGLCIVVGTAAQDITVSYK